MFGKSSKKLFFVFALVAFLTVSGFGQGTAVLSGTVTDANGAVIVGATVKALNLENNRETTVMTGSDGRFEFINLRAASYRISATNQGFATSAENIIVQQGATLTQNFSLSPGAINDVVTVTAGKGSARVAVDVPQVITVATEEDIERQRPRSTFEAIERAPNLIVRETNPARERPRLRGLDSSRLLIVIDGERLNNSRTDLNTGLSPSIIDVTQLQSAEVVAGAGSSLYGSDSLAGTINLVTKSPERPTQGVNLGFRFDGNYASNGQVRRGSGVVNLSNRFAAARLSGSLFRNENYSIGNDPITLEQVRAIGGFYTQFPGNNASQFPIFSVPAGGEVLNGAGHGSNLQFDLWVFPSDNHNFRARYINSSHSDLGDAFSGPPYETQDRFNAFRTFNKYGLRYEGLDFARYLPRVSVNYYHQKLTFPQNQFDFSIGGSFTGTSAAGFTFRNPITPSTFSINSFTDNKNSITTDGFEVQASIAPLPGLLVTTGYQYLRDFSSDEFSRFRVTSNRQLIPGTFTTGASSPDTTYTNNAFFMQGEFDRIRWLRLTAGFRVDNWKTNAQVTPGFPLGSEFAVLRNSIPVVTANPGPLDTLVSSLPSLLELTQGSGEVDTSNTPFTGNFGVVFRLPYGINPYLRYANSYREPSLTERYLIRNFIPTPTTFSALVVGNPNLDPETGRNLDVGVKFQNKFGYGSFGYFRNQLSNLIIFQTPISAANPSGVIRVASDAANGLLPIFPGGPHLVSFNGRVNQADNLISGFEATAQGSIPLGDYGSLNPFTSMGWLRGENESPTQSQIDIINQLYNRDDTPIRLEGSPDDVPLANITPYRTITGIQYADAKGKLFVEYAFRYQAQVKRANPTAFIGPTLVNFGTFASLDSFTKHSVKAGYVWRRENYRVSLNGGIENFTDELYFEHFQNAPAPGRSFILGITIDLFNVLKK